MKAKEIKTEESVCCERGTTIQKVSQMMLEYDCGCIPVAENFSNKKLIQGSLLKRVCNKKCVRSLPT